jgi:hypothetical protein
MGPFANRSSEEVAMLKIQVVKTRRTQSMVETDRRTPSGAVLQF